MRQSGKIIIVGGNAAGCAAAAEAARTNPSATIVILEKGETISTGTCELPYVLSGEISRPDSLKFFTPLSFREQKGVEARINTEVISIERKKKEVVVRDTLSGSVNELPYDSLVIATGSIVRREGVLQEAVYVNLFTLKTLSDTERILHYLTGKGKIPVVILGGGFIGLEAAEAFQKRGCEVTIIDREAALFHFAGAEVSRLVQTYLSNNGVTFFGDVPGWRFITEGDHITGVRIGSRTIEAGIVINCTGVLPSTELAASAKIELGKIGGIKTTNKMLTSDPSIYAAGDCVEYKDFMTGQGIFLPQATLAQRSGRVAGANAAGGNKFLQPVLRNISMRLFSHFVAHVGMTHQQLQSLSYKTISFEAIHQNLVPVMPSAAPNYLKIICDKQNGRILSASLFGGSEISGFADLLASFIRFGRHAADLSIVPYNYTPTLSHFTNPLAILGRKAEKFFEYKGL